MKYILVLAPTLLFAAGSGHGSPTDLIPSFVNVFVLAALLIWKVGPVVVSYFNSQAEEVDTVMRRAETKAKEASEMMAVTSKKMANSDSEIATLKSNAKAQIEEFKTTYSDEVKNKIERLSKDAEQKIEAEKKNLSDSVNELLVAEVISKAKSKISSDSNLQSSSTQEILKGL